MSDTNSAVTQEPVQAAPDLAAAASQPTPAGSSNPGSNENWEARFKGAMQSTERLTLEKRALEADLVAKTSEIERLNSQLALKDTEKTVAVGERDKKLEETLRTSETLSAELKQLRSLKLKVEVAKEIGRPDLLAIADHLPNFEDKELMTTAMKDFDGWSSGLVSERERQITAGITPAVSPVVSTPSGPASTQGWEQKINAMPLGSPERKKAMDDYFTWTRDQASQAH